jgi:hypothetical protein
MGPALRRIALASPPTAYTLAAPAVVGLLLTIHLRLWRMTLAPTLAAAEAAGLVSSLALPAAWAAAFLAWALLRGKGVAPDAPRAGLDLALWGVVARESSTVGLWAAVPPPLLVEEEFPVGVLRLAEATSALGLVAFGWGLALAAWGCALAAARRRAPGGRLPPGLA